VLPITRGSGARLVDNDGREYLDAVGGMWCTNIGLGRDEMADAIAAQVRDLAYANPFVDMTNVPSVQLAARLAELAPGDLNHVFFTCGGSTAIDATFRLVQFYQHALGRPEKRGILSRIDAYHGTTFASVSIGGKPGDRIPASTTSTTGSTTSPRRTTTASAPDAPSRSSPTTSSPSSRRRSTGWADPTGWRRSSASRSWDRAG
jgi:adenosylmethionine-8-amino-7-oxononanoate aminotransferase